MNELVAELAAARAELRAQAAVLQSLWRDELAEVFAAEVIDAMDRSLLELSVTLENFEQATRRQ